MASKFQKELSAELHDFFGGESSTGPIREEEKKKGVNWQIWQLREELEAKSKEHDDFLKMMRDRDDKLEKETRQLRKRFQESEKEMKQMKDQMLTHKKNEEKAIQELQLAKEREDLMTKQIEVIRNRELLLQKQLMDIAERTAQDTASRTLMKEINQEVRELLHKQSHLEKELMAQVDKTLSVNNKVNGLFTQVKSVQEEKLRVNVSVSPPTGEVTLVFTDVQGSTTQWEKFPDVMAKALRVHNDLMRSTFAPFGGYEVKTEGDAFMIAFSDTVKAMKWCVQTQEKLLQANWPEELFSHPDSAIEEKNGTLLWKGLRVRMGVHTGTPTCEPDPVTGRMDYFGPMVNRSARVEGTANGGQIMCSGEVWEKIKDRLLEVGRIEFRDMGFHRLKGLDTDTRIIEVLPASLKARNFPMYGASVQSQEKSKKLSERTEEINKESAELSTKLKSIQTDFDEQKKSAKTLQEKLRSLQKNYNEDTLLLVISDVEELISGHERTKEELLKVKKDNDTLNEELKNLAGGVADLKTQVNQLTEHNVQIMTENTAIKEEVVEIKQKSSQEIAQITHKLDQQHQVTQKVREEKSRLEDDVLELKEKLVSTKVALNKLLDRSDSFVPDSVNPGQVAVQCQDMAASLQTDYILEKKPIVKSIEDYLREVADAGKKFVSSLEDDQADASITMKYLHRLVQVTKHNMQYMNNPNQVAELTEYLQNLITSSSYFIYVRNKSKENTNVGSQAQIVDVAYGSVKEALGLMLKTIRAAAHQQGLRAESSNKGKEQLQKVLEETKTKAEQHCAALRELINTPTFNDNLFSQRMREIVNLSQSLVEVITNEELSGNLVKHLKVLLQKGAELRQEQNSERRKRFEEAIAQFENAVRHAKVFAMLG